MLVHPTGARLWPTFSAILFLLSFAATSWVVVRSLELPRVPAQQLALASAGCDRQA